MFTASASPIGFGRHVVAVLGSAMVAGTVFGLLAGIMVVADKPSMALIMASRGWSVVLRMITPLVGFLLTLAWPLLRHAGSIGFPVSIALCSAGCLIAMWSSKFNAGKVAESGELTAIALLGAVAGGTYWWIARRD